jgi:hypothetical protein
MSMSRWRQDASRHARGNGVANRRAEYDRRAAGKFPKRPKLTAAERREKECRAIEERLRAEGRL